MRRTTLLSCSLPTSLLLAFFAACGGDDGGSNESARFTTASELERQRAVMAAAGGDAALAYITGSIAISAPAESQCPKVTWDGPTATATFDCTDGDGRRIDGRLLATNVPAIFGEDDIDPTRNQVVTFEGFYQHGPTDLEDVALDGTVTLRPSGELAMELDASLMGIAAFSKGSLTSDGELARAGAGSFIDLEGIGRATIHGSWSMDSEAPAGVLELRGADVMQVLFEDAAGGCVPIAIDGKAAGQLCDDAGEE